MGHMYPYATVVHALNRQKGISFFDEVLLLHQTFPKYIAIDIIVMGRWNIWTQRDGNIFRNGVPGVIFRNGVLGILSWKHRLKQDLLLVKHRTMQSI